MAKVETNPFAKFTAQADSILKHIAPHLADISADVKKLAAVVVDVRASINREVKSRKTEKAVTVPDWDGRSPSYRDWYNDVLVPMINERIPVEYQPTIRTRLQNQVQEEVHRRATAAQKAHLGLKAQSKSAKQNEKRAAAKKPAERVSDETFSTDALATFAKETPIQDVAQAIAAQCEAITARIRAKDNGLTPAQSKKTNTLLAQSMQYLMSARSSLSPAPKATPEKVAA